MKIPTTETIEFFVMLWKRDANKEKLMDNFNELITKNSHFAFEIYLTANRLIFDINIIKSFYLKNLDFSGRIIEGRENQLLNLKNSQMTNIKFNDAILRYINFSKTHFYKSQLLPISVFESNFSHVIFDKCGIVKFKKHNNLQLEGIDYRRGTILS